MKKSLLALALLVVAGALLAVWFLSNSGAPERSADVRPGPAAAKPTAAPAPADVPEPTSPSSSDSSAASARETVVDPGAQGREARLLADAQWVDVDVDLPVGTPADEQLTLIAVGFAPDRFPTEDAAREALSTYQNGINANTWFGERDQHAKVRVDELPCERAADGHFRAPFPNGSKVGLLELKSRYVFSAEVPRVELPSERMRIETKLGAWLTAQLVLPSNLPADVDRAALDPISVTINGWKMGPQQESHGALAKVGADLAFEFGGLRPGLTYFLNAEPAQFTGFGDMNITAEAGQHIVRRYDLKCGALIRGRVLGAAGGPAADASVRAQNLKRRMFDTSGGREAKCAADGTFVLRGVTPGKVKVHALLKGSLEAMSGDLDLADGQVLEGLELHLGAGKTLAGRVLWPDGSPAADAIVTAFEKVERDGDRGSASADEQDHADAQGHFEIVGLSADLVEVRATLDRERADGVHEPWRVRSKDVPVANEVVLTLEPPHELHGRVVDDLDQPLTVFTLKSTEIVAQDDYRNPSTSRPTDSPDGTFTLALASGTWDVSAESDGHAESEKQRITLPGATADLVLKLARASSVSGVVRDPAGAPLADAEVAAETADKRRGVGRSSNKQKTDAQGHFLFDSIKPGAVTLVARHQSFAPSEPLTVPVLAGEPVAALELHLRVGGRLEGEIFDTHGAPEPGRQIMVGTFGFGQGDIGGNATSDGAGRFTVEHLGPGKYSVIATPRMDQFASDDGEMDQAALMASLKMTSIEIRDGETTHVVLGAPPKAPVRVTGRVTEGGQPFTGMVMAIAEGKSLLDSLKTAKVDGDGRYALTLDGPGNYSFIIGAGMGDDDSAEFSETVPEVAELELDFSVPQGGVRGRVLSRDGAPLESIPVTVQLEGRGSMFIVDMSREVRTDAEGRFEFKHLKPGSYTVRAGAGRWDAFRSSSLTHAIALRSGLVVEPDHIVDNVDIRLEVPGTISGTVLDAGGKPVAKAAVFVRDAQGRVINPISGCVSDGLGKFEFDGAAPGSYTLSARADKLASRDGAAVHVAADQTAEVEVRLEAGTTLRISVVDGEDKLVRAGLRVVDDSGREVSGLYGSDMMENLLTEGFSTTEQRVGPLAAGKYKVTATATDGTSVTKPVTLTGNEERFLRIKLKD